MIMENPIIFERKFRKNRLIILGYNDRNPLPIEKIKMTDKTKNKYCSTMMFII